MSAEPMPFAAAVYGLNTPDRTVLAEFVKKLTAANVRVEGILQEEMVDANGIRLGIDAIDISTGHRITIKHPMNDDGECGLDISALVEATSSLRKAIDNRPDLMVIEKFGEQEQNGGGMSDEIWQTITVGIPLIVSVPEKAIDIWQERSGGMGSVIPLSKNALHEWWATIGKT